jgi:hypothetical protein
MGSCEKDDICLEGTPATPRLVVVFRDYQDTAIKKSVENLVIQGFDQAEILQTFTGDSIALPLRKNFDFSQFKLSFNLDTDSLITDSLQFNYDRFDLYINRACGYKSNYTFQEPSYYLLTKSEGWIQNVKKSKDTISDEQNTHLVIYH